MLANEGINLPIAYTLTMIGSFRTLLDINAIRNTCAITRRPIALAIGLSLVSKMLIECSSRFFVCQNVLMNRFMMKRNDALSFQAARRLFRASVLFHVVVDE